MTLFANSGVAWPTHEQQTQDAGKKSLEAASHLFKVLAAIEGRSELMDRDALAACSDALDSAAHTYALVADQLKGEADIPALSPAEFEFSALPSYRHYYDESFYELFLNRRFISIRDLYLDLSQRATWLSSAVRTLNPHHSAVDLAASIFQIMRLWESMATLARLIATLGRRPERRG